MTVDLWMLLASCGLALFMSSVPLFRAMRMQWGFTAMVGNREGLPPLTGWGGRAERAYRNLMDNLTLFGVAALTVHLANASNETTALGSQIFFASRVVHAFVYTVGLSVIRTIAYLGGIAGTIVMVSQVF